MHYNCIFMRFAGPKQRLQAASYVSSSHQLILINIVWQHKHISCNYYKPAVILYGLS